LDQRGEKEEKKEEEEEEKEELHCARGISSNE